METIYSTIIAAELPVQIKRTDSTALEFTFSQDDLPFDLSFATEIIFTVKTTKIIKTTTIEKKLSLGEMTVLNTNQLYIPLTYEDTDVEGRVYYYNIQGTNAQDVKTILEGKFIVNENV